MSQGFFPNIKGKRDKKENDDFDSIKEESSDSDTGTIKSYLSQHNFDGPKEQKNCFAKSDTEETIENSSTI